MIPPSTCGPEQHWHTFFVCPDPLHSSPFKETKAQYQALDKVVFLHSVCWGAMNIPQKKTALAHLFCPVHSKKQQPNIKLWTCLFLLHSVCWGAMNIPHSGTIFTHAMGDQGHKSLISILQPGAQKKTALAHLICPLHSSPFKETKAQYQALDKVVSLHSVC